MVVEQFVELLLELGTFIEDGEELAGDALDDQAELRGRGDDGPATCRSGPVPSRYSSKSPMENSATAEPRDHRERPATDLRPTSPIRGGRRLLEAVGELPEGPARRSPGLREIT